jgi:hypothetical protein
MDNPTGQEAAQVTAGAKFARALSTIFLVSSGFAALGRLMGWAGPSWAEALYVANGLAVTFVWLNRNLPIQNVLLAMATLASLGFVAVLAVEAAKPGSHLELALPPTQAPELAKYMQAVAWALLLLNVQGMARLFAVRWEQSAFYGFWILGLASTLVCAFQVGLQVTAGGPSTTPWALKATMMAGWYCFAFLCLALASPAQLKRKPGPRVVSVEPVWVWIGLNLLVMATAANRGLWTAAALQGVITVLGAWPVLRSSRIRLGRYY